MTCLVTSGSAVKIWETPSFHLVDQFNAHSEQRRLEDVCCSHDGKTIVTCGLGDSEVHLRSMSSLPTVPEQTFSTNSPGQCLDFNSDSKLLLCGCTDGSIQVYDTKAKNIKKSIQHKHAVSKVRWNWNDTNVAFALQNGELSVYNVATVTTSTLMPSNEQITQQLKYNPYYKSSLVSASDQGVVSFWDTNTRRLVHTFKDAHNAPACDLVFSPLNDKLMLSVGLDTKVVFYDTKSRDVIKKMAVANTLLSVDIMSDGETVAVGTADGLVYFFDLRNDSTPVTKIAAHRSSVNHLNFVTKAENINLNWNANGSTVLPASVIADLSQNSLSNCHDSKGPKELHSDIFSPLRFSHEVSRETADRSYDFSRSLSKADNVELSGGIFSPVRDASRNGSLPPADSFWNKTQESETEGTHSNNNTSTKLKESPRSNTTTPPVQISITSPKPSKPSPPKSQDTSSHVPHDQLKNGFLHSTYSPKYNYSKRVSFRPEDERSSTARNGQPNNEMQGLRLMVREVYREHVDELKTELREIMRPALQSPSQIPSASSGRPEGMESHSLQTEYICKFIQEELTDLKMQVAEEANRTRFEQMKHSFWLEKKIEAWFQQIDINPLLLDEIDRLRRENNALRRTF